MDVRLQKKGAMVACGAAALALGLSGCSGAGFDGSGSKEAASAEQLAMRADDPWAVEVTADPAAKAAEPLRDGVYTGTGKGMDGLITVTLLIEDNHITCIETAQEGESQSVGGYEAVRDGVCGHDRRGAGLGHRRGVGRDHHDGRHPPGRRGRPRAGAGIGE